MQEVRGSNPLISTMDWEGLQGVGNRRVVSLFPFWVLSVHLRSGADLVQHRQGVLKVGLRQMGIAHAWINF